jgi:hypothetical protein
VYRTIRGCKTCRSSRECAYQLVRISAMVRLRVHKPFSLYMMAVLSLGSSVLRCEGNAESKLNNKHELEVDCTYSY